MVQMYIIKLKLKIYIYYIFSFNYILYSKNTI